MENKSTSHRDWNQIDDNQFKIKIELRHLPLEGIGTFSYVIGRSTCTDDGEMRLAGLEQLQNTCVFIPKWSHHTISNIFGQQAQNLLIRTIHYPITFYSSQLESKDILPWHKLDSNWYHTFILRRAITHIRQA